MRPTLYLAITNHGFGHATRAASVAGMLQKLNPEILLILVTTAPRWLLESYIPGDFIHRPKALDVGVIQSDSLTLNLPATLEKLKEIRTRQHQIIASEVEFIRNNRVNLLLGDIPPLAAPIARAAGIPGWMMSNFGWDFIYRDWGGEFVEMADWIAECFGKCDRLFRLPLHEQMSAFPNITDVGLTGGTPHYPIEQLREEFNLTQPPEKTAILTFGGLGLQKIPYNKIEDFPDWQFITFDNDAPDLPNLVQVKNRKVSAIHDQNINRTLQPVNLRPVDFMPLCGRVVSKPGFSTFSEALRLETPIVSLTREGFAEAFLLVDGLKNYGHHQIVNAEDFFNGHWDFLHQPISPPLQTSQTLPTDGTERISHAILDYISTCT